jgi:hypothetical protein
VTVFAIGLVLLVVGVGITSLSATSGFLWLSAVGFLLMFGGAVLAVASIGPDPQGQAGRARQTASTLVRRLPGRAPPAAVRAGVTPNLDRSPSDAGLATSTRKK